MTSLRSLAALTALIAQMFSAFASGPVPNAEEERLRLENERSAAEHQHAVARAACYQHFEVNQCLSDAKRRQREALTEIKRQERLLHADERKRKAIAQVQKIDERNSLESQETSARERARRANEQMDRQDRSATKTVGKPQAAARDKPDTKNASESGRTAVPSAKVSPNVKTVESEKNQAEFNKKQQEATDHRADLEKRRRERSTPLAAPLPAPLPVSPSTP
jgi:hypothetical protein